MHGHSCSKQFRRLTDAKDWARAKEQEIISGEVRAEVHASTMSEAIERYIREVLNMKRPSVLLTQELHLRWWQARIGHMTISSVRPSDIVACRTELQNGTNRQGRDFSPTTIRQYLQTLSHVFTTASKEWGLIESNPMHNVSKPSPNPGRRRYLSQDELERLRVACHESQNKNLEDLILMAVSTGCRFGELITLTWERINLEQRILTIPPELEKS